MLQVSSQLPWEQDKARIFASALDEAPNPLFAVADGSQFEDLPGELSSAGLFCQSLFLNHKDKSFERAGPWLFSLDSVAARQFAQKLAIDKPCLVVWSCAVGQKALWRHLRSINEVLIPLPNPKKSDPASPDNFERVLFRHWDPNVLAQVLPTLNHLQFARFFGPAETIIFLPDKIWGGKATTSSNPQSIEAPAGPLCFERMAMNEIEAQRRAVQCDAIVDYLKITLPDLKEPHDDKSLRIGVSKAVSGAEAYGVTDPAALNRWSYLYFISGGAINSDKNIAKFMTSRDFKANPNEKVRQVMDAMIYATKEKAKCL